MASYFMLPYLEYGSPSGPMVDASLAPPDGGLRDAGRDDVLALIGNEDALTAHLGWGGFEFGGTVGFEADGTVWMMSLFGEGADAAFSLELSPNRRLAHGVVGVDVQRFGSIRADPGQIQPLQHGPADEPGDKLLHRSGAGADADAAGLPHREGVGLVPHAVLRVPEPVAIHLEPLHPAEVVHRAAQHQVALLTGGGVGALVEIGGVLADLVGAPGPC